jgi:hypothetical protein
MKKKSNKRPIRNLCFYQGRWMTEHDRMVIHALNYARGIVPKENIIPRRNNGRIDGFYIINEGGETALMLID